MSSDWDENVNEPDSTRPTTSDVAAAESPPVLDIPTAEGDGIWAGSIGVLLSGAFYGVVWISGLPALERYFLGHPVAVAATVLFWIALAILATKWWTISAQWNRFKTIRDEDLLPPAPPKSPTGRWLGQHDAGFVARGWLTSIAELSGPARASQLVVRLGELLSRQAQRGTSKHLGDDLRELSDRDADAAHESLGLVRIIVWAIPMLGFLGTVIGITQTLGGLDFTDGTAAVDRLKSGLYVAFDTTAIGLVLSVAAIFIQFPIERSEQRLLAAIDSRVGKLISTGLPSDEAADNQTALIGDLCEGIQVAVAQSLASQAELWRQTIDEANRHWEETRGQSANAFATAIEQTLTPALQQHGRTMAQSLLAAGDRMDAQLAGFAAQTDGQADRFDNALRDHAMRVDDTATVAGNRLEDQVGRWQRVLEANNETTFTQLEAFVKQCELLAENNRHTESIQSAHLTLDAGLERLRLTNDAVARSVEAAGGDGMAQAMRILARAVDALSGRLPERPADPTRAAAGEQSESARRVA